jgi:hypothetical protein
MSSNDLLLAIAGGISLQCILLYLVINVATKADKRSRYEWAQTQFLAHLAKQQGLPAEQIQRILDATN